MPSVFQISIDLGPQPESTHEIEAQLQDLSLQDMPQVLHLGSAHLQRLRELFDQIRFLGIGFPVNEGHHNEPLHKLLPELRIGKRPGQFCRRDWSKLFDLIGGAEDPLNRFHHMPLRIVEHPIRQCDGLHRPQSPVGLFWTWYL